MFIIHLFLAASSCSAGLLGCHVIIYVMLPLMLPLIWIKVSLENFLLQLIYKLRIISDFLVLQGCLKRKQN